MAGSWQVVVEFGRDFDIEIIGRHKSGPPQYVRSPEGIAIPFNDRESAEAAQREIRVYVRPVHDAGGEDYRPVVPGEVVRDFPCCDSRQIARGEGNAAH